ncbi:MAG: ABC transporter ATP-binding protein [Lachnospiraceae bacterium]|nr:ABC transporter ATP-binding protein [Lachnospiraceae bacterium]
MITFENVSFSYGSAEKPVLSNISFYIGRGESVGLIGANGAGKSTVMKLLLGLLKGTGRIVVDGKEVQADTLSYVRKKLGFVLQNSDDQMFMPTVLEDMMFGPLNYGADRKTAEEAADRTLERLGLMYLKNRHNHRLSEGEKRMAAIATVLAMEPEGLLMDEPTASLDPFNRRIVIDTINAQPQTKIITSHDLDMICDTCPRVILLSRGSVEADGPADEILRDRALLERCHLELPIRYQFR